MKTKWIAWTVAFVATMLGLRAELPDGLYAEITTPRGVIVTELFFKKAPMTCASFVGLAEGTLGPQPRKPFFNGLTFHRVVPGFVIQGGDPNGTGSGGPGYAFPDEIVAGLRHDGPGVMQMANSGPDTNGSQFVLMLGAAPHLDYAHTIFGRTISGLDVLPNIQAGDTMQVKILRVGKAAQAFKADEKTFARLVAKAPRLAQSHFVDVENLLPPEQPWRPRYYDTKLANLHRFTGRHAYVRLFDEFVPDAPGQTKQQWADVVYRDLHLPEGAALVVYFAATDEWILSAGGPKEVKLPAVTSRIGAKPKADDIEAMKIERKRISAATVEIINGLITQLEPKKTRSFKN